MAFKDSNGNTVQLGSFSTWIASLPEPQQTQYRSINQTRIDSGNEPAEFTALWTEFVATNGLVYAE